MQSPESSVQTQREREGGRDCVQCVDIKHLGVVERSLVEELPILGQAQVVGQHRDGEVVIVVVEILTHTFVRQDWEGQSRSRRYFTFPREIERERERILSQAQGHRIEG